MTTWFTSDLHFGHANIIRYCGRPFADVEEMDAALVERWNETVGPGDDVWVLGDFALGTIAETLPIAGALRGRKVLLAGNHDRCFDRSSPRWAGWEQRYLDAGFAEVRYGAVPLDVAGTPVLACHFPYEGDSRDEERFVRLRPVDEGGWLLHGHVHEQWQQRRRMVNVGTDVWGYRPVSEATIAELVAAGPRDR